MAALTENRSTEVRSGIDISPLVKDAEIIFCGAMVAINTSTGEAEPAADAASLVVKGRAEEYVDNTEDGERVRVRSGVYKWENSATNAVTNAHRFCYVEDDQTVSSAGGDNNVVAGVVVEVESDGVWVDCRAASIAAALGISLPESAFSEAVLVADPAAMADLTYADPGAITYSDPAAITAASPAWGDTTSVNQASNLTTFSDAVVADLGAIRTALIALGADVPAIRTKLLAAGVDLGAAKTAVDANNAAIDAVIDALQGGGLMATE